jgi:twitching motility protein PilU
MYLDRLFKLMAEKQASDLFISCGAPINLKVNGVVQPVSTQPMDIDTVRRIAYELMNKEQAREFENTMEMNLSHLDRAVGNFRVNIFRQRGTISLVIRYVRSNVPPFEQLQAAVGAARPRDGEARPDAVAAPRARASPPRSRR